MTGRQSPNVINMILLGETGVGKSTFVNAFINYAQYRNLNEAIEGPLFSPIPVSFVIEDKHGTQRNVKVGPDDVNENLNYTGESATRKSKSYLLQFDEFNVRLIDTPGICDTKGHEKDQENLKDIIDVISDHDQIHGVAVILKSDLSKPNMYVVDNDAMRYIGCIKQNIALSTNEIRQYEKNWARSSNECKRLLKHLQIIEPHSIVTLISISKARKSIEILQQPLFDVLESTLEQETILKDHEKYFKSHENDIELLKKRLYVPEVKLEMEKLSVPQTVCKSKNCEKTYKVHGMVKNFYPQVCCENCRVETAVAVYNIAAKILNIVQFFTPSKSLPILSNIRLPNMSMGPSKMPMRLFCQAMSLPSGTCRVCQCKTDQHELELYKTKLVEAMQKVETVEAELSNAETIKEQTRLVLEQTKSKLKENENERQMILNALANFSCFLNNNAIVPYMDVLEQFLIALNKEDITTRSMQNEKETLYYSLLTDYKNKKQRLDENKEGLKITPKDIDSWMKKLCEMKLNGQLIQHAKRIMEEMEENQHDQRYREQCFRISNNFFNDKN
ncbi:hypothetical protein CHUAL_011755 [Chamberlinius hualienensis]